MRRVIIIIITLLGVFVGVDGSVVVFCKYSIDIRLLVLKFFKQSHSVLGVISAGRVSIQLEGRAAQHC